MEIFHDILMMMTLLMLSCVLNRENEGERGREKVAKFKVFKRIAVT